MLEDEGNGREAATNLKKQKKRRRKRNNKIIGVRCVLCSYFCCSKKKILFPALGVSKKEHRESTF